METSNIIDGKNVAKQIRVEMTHEIRKLRAMSGKEKGPTLVVFLVGDRKDSATYVRMKRKACEEVGMSSVQHNLDTTITQKALVDKIQEYSKSPLYNGILVQLPLPDHMDTNTVLQSIDPTKDVDGLHIMNQGDLFVNGHNANMIPCTPKGCLELLDRYKVPIEGKHAVVLGRSRLVGKPIGQLLLSRNATVTQCHSRTQNLEQVIGTADILVSCVGKPGFVKGEWLRPGVVVIDVGINSVDDATKKRGYRLVGDIDFESAKQKASLITPVPGGVGPMTVAMLLSNTIKSYRNSLVV